jgi:hypothetical protein
VEQVACSNEAPHGKSNSLAVLIHRRSSFPRGPSEPKPALTVSNYHRDERLSNATGVLLHLGWKCTTSVHQTPQQQRQQAEHQGQATLRHLWLAGRRPREVLPCVRPWGRKLLRLPGRVG